MGMQFDMNAIWSRGIALVSDNFQLLAVIAGVFLLIPSIASYFLFPDFATLTDPTADPEMVTAMITDMIGPILIYGVVAMVFQFAGYGAMIAMMGAGRPTVGESIAAGFKSVPTMFGVFVLFFVAYFVVALAIMLPISVIAALTGASLIGLFAPIIILPMIVYLMARFSMSMPVALLEGTLNPVKVVTRSWSLTKPKQWQVLGFWAILGVAYIVISLLFLAVFGLLGALVGDATGSILVLGLLNGLVAMAVGMVVCGLTVAMYTQLSGISEADVSDTFE